jgi:D-inositol-3-phosphate glycosyltransferase
MISFVWSSRYPFIAGSGGSETYTAGQIRELLKRGIPARIITIGHGDNDGRADFPDIPFLSLDSKDQLAELDDLIVYITYPLEVKTKHQAFAILHCPPPTYQHDDPLYNKRAFKGVRLITASKFAGGIWRRNLRHNFERMPTVYPFADEAFRKVERPRRAADKPVRMLFAGRLHPDKGIYTLLCALHMETLKGRNFMLTVTTAGSNTEDGEIILNMLKANPQVKIVKARKDASAMAKLMAKHDIVIMPSSNIFWQELFGMLSIEAQHAGCRVVASLSGGLPETNLGGLMLVRPDDPKALAIGMAQAIERGPLTVKERQLATRRFTVKQSVDSLLKAISYKDYLIRTEPAPYPRIKPAEAVATVKQQLRTARPRTALGLASLGVQSRPQKS